MSAGVRNVVNGDDPAVSMGYIEESFTERTRTASKVVGSPAGLRHCMQSATPQGSRRVTDFTVLATLRLVQTSSSCLLIVDLALFHCGSVVR